ncbi:unnamed protein product [Penicillium palitans]
MCLPSAVSIVSENFSPGKLRNLAFSFIGGGQPIGFGLGMLMGGVCADTIGWRWGFHSAAIANRIAFLLSWWQLPQNTSSPLTGSHHNPRRKYARKPSTIAYFAVSGVLLLCFVIWQEYQERRGKPTLIRNSLWRKKSFTSICINVFIIWGAFNGFEQIINFSFQNVQELSVLDAALRFIPTPITGLLSALVTGLVLHRIRADAIINITILVSCISPLMITLVNPSWVYSRCAFIAICLNSIAADCLFTVDMCWGVVFVAEWNGLIEWSC